MCFSASASFTAGVVLTIAGVATIKKTHHPSQMVFAGIPLIFGVQQLAEGVLWLTLSNPDYENIQKTFTYIFLFFAQVLWPIWVPIAILLLEKSTTRKNLQKALIGVGLVAGGYLAYCLLTFKVEAHIMGHHIRYFQDYPPRLRNYEILLYAMAIVAPAFVSHVKRMWILGTTIAISYIVTAIFYEHYVLSVWCFFSAIISLSIYFIMIGISKTESNRKTARG